MEKDVTHKRKLFIDIAKGLLIILVVLSHSDFWGSQYIFWFHMPAFFMISGYLMKSEHDVAEYRFWVIRTFKKLAVPYVMFYLFYLCVVYLAAQPNAFDFAKDIAKFIYGGRLIHGVFWFITCLFLSEVIFKYLLLKFNNKIVLGIVFILYIFAHVESSVFQGVEQTLLPKVPWNIDVSFIAIPYLAIGYYIKNYLLSAIKDIKFSIGVSLAAIGFIALNYFGIINYNLDLKYIRYNHLVLDLVIPFIFFLFIIIISYAIEKKHFSKALSYVGENSLIMMYLHVPLNLLFGYWFNYNFVIYLLIGVLGSIIFTYFIRQWRFSRYIFLGEQKVVKKIMA